MKRPLAFAILSVAIAITILSGAQAQGKKAPATKAPVVTDDAEVGTTPMATREEKPQPTAKAERDAGVVEQKTLDGGARVFRFGEVEVEGRLKSPQIVYFLRRVRAEFAAGDLGHRSFMREMSETRNEPHF
jgi:hypothetical protein